MELVDLIHELQTVLDEANIALEAKERDEARKYLRTAKKLLDEEFLAEKPDWHGG